MTENKKHKFKHVTLKSLADRLRRLPEPEVPETLEEKLLAAIPDRQPEPARGLRLRWYRAWDFGATAVAAVLIFALMFLVSYGLSTPSHNSIADFDTSLCYTELEQRIFLYDQNNTYLEKSGPYEVK